MDELFKDMKDKGLISFEKPTSNPFDADRRKFAANSRLTLELLNTVPIGEVEPDFNDAYVPEHLQIDQLNQLSVKIDDRRN